MSIRMVRSLNFQHVITVRHLEPKGQNQRFSVCKIIGISWHATSMVFGMVWYTISIFRIYYLIAHGYTRNPLFFLVFWVKIVSVELNNFINSRCLLSIARHCVTLLYAEIISSPTIIKSPT